MADRGTAEKEKKAIPTRTRRTSVEKANEKKEEKANVHMTGGKDEATAFFQVVRFHP